MIETKTHKQFCIDKYGSTEFQTDFSKEIWENTYKDSKDETINDTFYRVANAVASVEKTDELKKHWTEKFYDLLTDFKFTAGGRIYSNAGTEWKGTTLMNCFTAVKPTYDLDSLEGIMITLKNQAQTLKSEGGWGLNFSFIRPRGSFIYGIGVETPGAVTYMEIFNKSSDIITQGSGKKSTNSTAKGKIRKGAMMAVLDCISGDTLISTINGKIPIKDLVNKKPLVYCTDQKGNVFVRKANKVWSKGVQKTIRILIDNDDYLVCTPEHKILLKNGTYKLAKDLKLGDSLSVFHKRLYGKYYQLGVAGYRINVAEHIAVCEYKYNRYPNVKHVNGRFLPDSEEVHHIDLNSLNNNPENLEFIKRKEHLKKHFEQSMDIFNAHRKRISEERKNKTWDEYYGKEKSDKIKQKRKKTEVKIQGERIPWNKGIDKIEYEQHFKNGFRNQFSEDLPNHKVVLIEDWKEIEVFDMSVPDFHNFVANGIFVHNCTHPDVEEFISAKLTEGRLDKFNISVNCSDEFIEKIIKVKDFKKQNLDYKEEDKWNLEFPDTTHEMYKDEWNGDLKYWKSLGYPVIIYKTVSASDLWDQIMKSTYTRNDPGVLLLDRANYTYCYNYGGKDWVIRETNPCFSGSTLIAVADGRGCVPIKQLAEEAVDVPVYSYNLDTGTCEIKWGRNPRITGKKQRLLKVVLDDNSEMFVTENHKFITMDGREIEAKDLKKGDSLPRITRDQTKFSKKESANFYWRIRNTKTRKQIEQIEHRMIAKFNNLLGWDKIYDEQKKNGWIKGGLVVHHKDFNGLNNSPENLEIMTYSDHSAYHAKHSFSGESNPMYGKKHSKETKVKIGKKTKDRCSDKEYLEKFKLSVQLSMTNEIKEKISNKRTKTELDRRIKEAERVGLKPVVVDGELYVEKICEISKKPFLVKWRNRQRAYSYEFHSSQIDEFKAKATENRKKVQAVISQKNLHKQVMIYKDLKENSEIVYLVDFVKECKEKGVTCRFNPSSDNEFIMPSYKAFVKYAEEYNHRVKYIELTDRYEDVYNITVDDNHTLAVITKSTNKSQSGVFVRNCGEQAIPPSGVCLLGSHNLTQYVNSTTNKIDIDKLEKYTSIATRFLDNINDLTKAPLPEYIKTIKEKRRIGLGILGWGSLLYMLKTKFASNLAEDIKSEFMKTITHVAVKTSIDLAKEKGMFVGCDPQKHADHVFWKQIELDEDTLSEMRKYGIRNSSLFSIQPTGNTSIMANIVSGGLEPVFMPEYIRTLIVPNCPDELRDLVPKYWTGEFHETDLFKFSKEGNDNILIGEFNGIKYKIDKNRGLTKEQLCSDYGVRYLKELDQWDEKEDWASTTENLSADEHILDMKGFGKWIDSSQSKTINLPNDYPFEDFENIYLDAWKTGYLKGVTTYRAGTMATVLKSINESHSEDKISKTNAPKRPKELPCDIIHTTVEGEKWVVFVGLLDNDPYEIFGGLAQYVEIPKKYKTGTIKKNRLSATKSVYDLHVGDSDDELVIKNISESFKDDNYAWATRMISLALRHGSDVTFVVEQLTRDTGVSFHSFSKVIGRVLKKYIIDGAKSSENCPDCESKLVFQEGCVVCINCGFTKCS